MRRRNSAALAFGLMAAVVSACGKVDDSSTAGPESTPLTEVSTSVPSSDALPDFDACNELDAAFLRAHDLDAIDPRPVTNEVADYRWSGCIFQTSTYIGVHIGVTNATVEDAISKDYTDTVETVIGDRRAVHFDILTDNPGDCTLFVAMTGGSLDVEVDVFDREESRGTDPCQFAIDTAIAVEPLIPE